jgi:hypothetical protein
VASDDPMAGKVSFDDIYDRPDPRAYFRTLSRLQYQIPEHARGFFSFLARLLRHRAETDRFSVLDLCCSYGINATLLNHDLSLAELYARYQAAELDALGSDELAASDREFYASRRRADTVPVVGLDAAVHAVGYALRAGLLEAGCSENLEESGPGDELKGVLTDVGLITVTGGIGYITEATFDHVLGSAIAADPPWVAAFSLRWVDMTPIAAVLERYGLRLETLRGHTFRQRRFANEDEREHAFAQLRRLGLDPDGVEADGYHHTAFYLARPREEVDVVPIDVLLEPVL